MLAATNMLKPPPIIIGSLNREINLPRTVRLTTLLLAGAGAVAGFLAVLSVFGAGIEALIYGPVVGGGVGWAAANFSPLQGESLARWFGIRATSMSKRQVAVDGRTARLYVGIAPLRRTAAGVIHVIPGAVPVITNLWDARGLPQRVMPHTKRLAKGPPKPGGRQLSASTELSSRRRWRRRKTLRAGAMPDRRRR